MMPKNEKQKLLLVGFGDIAKRLAKHLDKKISANYDITGIRRSTDTGLLYTSHAADEGQIVAAAEIPTHQTNLNNK